MTQQTIEPPTTGQPETLSAEGDTEQRQPRKRRQRARSSIFAHGEPMVWLTGGALVLSVIMIIGLLGIVSYFGLSTFWPMKITKVTTIEGKTYMGEITRKEHYTPQPGTFDYLPEVQRMSVQRAVEEGEVLRRLFRTGNFRITQRHFHWVDEVLVEEEAYPRWAVIVERLEWGRFYGFPEAFATINYIPNTDAQGARRSIEDIRAEARVQAEAISKRGQDEVAILVKRSIDGREQETLVPAAEIDTARTILGVARMAVGSQVAWGAFEEHHGKVRAQWKERRHLEKHDIGEINSRQEKARQRVALRKLDMEEALASDGENSDAYRAAAQAHVAATAEYAETTAWASKEFERVRQDIEYINEQNGRYRLVMTTAGEADTPPKTTLMRLDDIVRAYTANQLSTSEKWGVYASRWWEFLSEEPREANSEGGVFPAIFGTVAMTFIMIIIVVPFGVLASLYLREYAKSGPVVSAVRIAVNNLAGVPSIVFGVFGLGFFCYGVGSYIDSGSSGTWSTAQWTVVMLLWSGGLIAGTLIWRAGFSRIDNQADAKLRFIKGAFITVFLCAILAVGFMLVSQMPFFDGLFRAQLPNPTYGKGGLLWASLTLSLLTLPVVIVATEEALSAVPNSMREGSYACGASKWQTIKRIVLPRAMPGIMTGMVLAMARGAGEVAPLMLVGAVKLAPELPIDSIAPFLHAERSFMHLGFHIYDVGFQSQNSEAAKPMVYTTTMLLIGLVVLMNLLAVFLRNQLRKKFTVQAF